MSEQALQRDILSFFKNQIYGLDYNVHPASIVNTENLTIKKDIVSWFTTGINEVSWRKVLKKHGNEDELINELVSKVDSVVMQQRNAALYFYNNQTFHFNGERFYTFAQDNSHQKSGGRLNKIHSGGNVFTIVEEMSYVREFEGKSIKIRPDLTFFINGVYIGYQELKHLYTGQSSHDSGVKKIAFDYCQFFQFAKIEVTADRFRLADDYKHFEKRVMQLFSQAIHISAYDCRDFLVLRNINTLLGKNDFKGGSTNKARDKVIENFKPFEVKKPFGVSFKGDEDNKNWKWVYHSHFSKFALQNDVFYYNFLNNSNKNKAVLISPRPKQKFAVDKCMDRILQLIEHDGEDFIKNEILENEYVKDLSVEVKQDMINKIEKLKTNKYSYSLLLQYAAGFGKTNIIGWLALRLRDIITEQDTPVFDKILLVSDRLDLREQINTMLNAMNLEKSIYAHANSKETMKEALTNNSRIIVVNIQKFSDSIKSLFSDDVESSLKQLRVAILIDEIHRSNTGSQHENMLDAFTDLSSNVNKGKKNLLIGLTATPTDDSLLRFGERVSTSNMRTPFDSFTMLEALKGGFILDPVSKLTGLQIIMEYADIKEGEDLLFSKSTIYENEGRINLVASRAADIMFYSTFKKISGRGKAMLACHSIAAASKYYYALKKEFESRKEKLKEKTNQDSYNGIKDAAIYVVYTNKQGEDSASKLMDGKSEHEVIKEFKSDSTKNAVIIVVKKLQTGFDDPRIHTLFLDREVNDIEAVQTVCRVNRIHPNKEDCAVIDFSHDNANMKNIKFAFEKYTGISVNNENIESIEHYFLSVCKFVFTHPIKQRFYPLFRTIKWKGEKEAEFANKVIDAAIESDESKEEYREYRSKLSKYLDLSDKYKVAILIPDDYVSKKYQGFAYRMLEILKNFENHEKEVKTAISINNATAGGWLNAEGESIEYNLDEGQGKSDGKGGGSDKNNSYSKFLEVCENEEHKRMTSEQYFEKRNALFELLKEVNSNQMVDLIKANKELESNDKIVDGFDISLSRISRKVRSPRYDQGVLDVEFISLIISIKEILCSEFQIWVKEKHDIN